MTLTPEIAKDMLNIINTPIARTIINEIHNQYTIELEPNDLFELQDTVIELLTSEQVDFDVSIGTMEFRIIHNLSIDGIQQQELLDDLYTLGCFNECFLAQHLPLDIEDIEALQEAEAFEAIGKIASKNIKDIQKEYSSLDGYGHHFAHYDHTELEVGDYTIFRTN